MSLGEMFMSGLGAVFGGGQFLMVLLAIVLGTVFGALPGVSATMAVALGLTFTYTMEPVPAIVFLVAIYCSSITGGSITAILFKIPGVPSSAPTTFDGYPMAQRGEAGKALGVSLLASAIGGIFAAVVMFLMSSPLSKAAQAFSQGDLFAVTFLGLSILVVLDADHILTTIISGLLGLLLACIGTDPMMGITRLTFGSQQLMAGIEMIPVLIGLFAVTEVLKQCNTKKRLSAEDGVAGNGGKVNTKMPSFKEIWAIKWTMLRCSAVGTVVGILPGAGATIASFMCYTMEQKLSKYPEKFGTGIIDGIAASEAANNAATGGAMVPLLTMGIPGGNAAAVMASALALKGVQMGPLLLTNQPEFLSATFITMIVTNILMVIVAMGIAKVFAQILAIPYYYLGPIIVMLALIGSYSEGAAAGVMIMVIAGILGIAVKYMHLNSAAIVLGLVLGGMCESHFARAFQTCAVVVSTKEMPIKAGELTFGQNAAKVGQALFGTPIAAVLMTACILLLLSPLWKPLLAKLKAKKA
ncbi:MAG: tripartite tricarboxylate transporter permease [Clostridia bacterium]|nr:tripartite tricarboxylate transporter permease [Clostridia bacterium]